MLSTVKTVSLSEKNASYFKLLCQALSSFPLPPLVMVSSSMGCSPGSYGAAAEREKVSA